MVSPDLSYPPLGHYGTPNPLSNGSIQPTRDQRPHTPFNVGKSLIVMSEELDRTVSQKPDTISVKKLGVPIIPIRAGAPVVDQRYVERRNPGPKVKEKTDSGQNEEQKVRLGFISARPVEDREWHRHLSVDFRTETNSIISAPDNELPDYRKPYKDRTAQEMTEGFYMRKPATTPVYYIPAVDYEPPRHTQEEYGPHMNDIQKYIRSNENPYRQRGDNIPVYDQLISNERSNAVSLRDSDSRTNDYRGNSYRGSKHPGVSYRENVSQKDTPSSSNKEEIVLRQTLAAKGVKSKHSHEVEKQKQPVQGPLGIYSTGQSNSKNSQSSARGGPPRRVIQEYQPPVWPSSDQPELNKEKLRRVQRLGVSVFPE